MAINKIIVDGVTKIDLSQDTVTADKVLEGLTFHDATGSLCTGTMKQSTGGADVGDFILYTKFAYDYNDYVNNSNSGAAVTAYLEDGSYTQSLIYLVVYSNGEICNVYSNYNDVDSVPQGCSVYVGYNKKISSVDVNFGGGCGC